MDTFLETIRFNEQGLVPAIIQDAASKQVLTLCYLNREALEKTLAEGEVYVFRRSAGRLMKKGEKSGHTQQVRAISVDCEGKSLLIEVAQQVAACHAGYFTCYFRQRAQDGSLRTVGERVFDPSKVY